MSNLSKKEFAKLCGMTSRTLAIYIARGKVITDKHGYINDRNELNALFIAKYNKASTNFTQETASLPQEITAPGIMEPKNENNLSLVAIERKRKLAELKKIEIESRISLLKEEKLKGANIPVYLVKDIIAALSKSFIIEFKNESESIIRILTKTKNYSLLEQAEIRGALSGIINDAMKKSLVKTKKELKTISENYSFKQSGEDHD